jgi:hypothetical protein
MEFSILMVEYGLWARVTSNEKDGLSMAVHVQKPNDAATVMVTGDAVVRALVDHKITLREALDRDLVVFSGKSEGTLAARLGAAIEHQGPRTLDL